MSTRYSSDLSFVSSHSLFRYSSFCSPFSSSSTAFRLLVSSSSIFCKFFTFFSCFSISFCFLFCPYKATLEWDFHILKAFFNESCLDMIDLVNRICFILYFAAEINSSFVSVDESSRFLFKRVSAKTLSCSNA